MAKTEPARRQYAKLSFTDGEVVVTPRDRDIFFISAEKATEAWRKEMQQVERIKQFESEFLIPLHDWCVAHEGRVRACYIPVPSNHIPVFVVTNSPRFDFDLAAEIAGLERKLVQSGWRVGVSQLPNADDESLATFFSNEGALEVYAQRGPASEESGE
jgi:hypothetical protein